MVSVAELYTSSIYLAALTNYLSNYLSIYLSLYLSLSIFYSSTYIPIYLFIHVVYTLIYIYTDQLLNSCLCPSVCLSAKVIEKSLRPLEVDKKGAAPERSMKKKAFMIGEKKYYRCLSTMLTQTNKHSPPPPSLPLSSSLPPQFPTLPPPSSLPYGTFSPLLY